MGLFNFKAKKEKREQEQREQEQVQKARKQKEIEDKLFFEAVRREDKKRNFYFMPLTSINRTDSKYEKNSAYGSSVVFESIRINGHMLPLYNFNENFMLSLKPGKYNVKVYARVDRELGIEENAKIKDNAHDRLTSQALDARLKDEGFHEATINVNESDECYLLFKTTIASKFTVSRTELNGTTWTTRDFNGCKYGYQFCQTSKGALENLCDYCIVSPTQYVYPALDQMLLQDYIKTHAHELPKSEQVAKSIEPKSTPSAGKTTTKLVESKPATKTTVSTAEKPVAKRVETTTAKTTKTAETKKTSTAKTTAKVETKAPVPKPVAEKPVKKTLSYPNGDRYEGYVLGFTKHGKGTLYYANGNKYEGDFENNLPHGKGTLFFNDVNDKKTKGHVYTGDFAYGKMNGFGVYAYPNGMRYEGGFANDLRDGAGKMFDNQKFLFDTLYKDGQDIKPEEQTPVEITAQLEPEEVIEDFSTLKTGKLNQNGYRYVGQIKDGKRHGFGFSFESDGINIGEFKNDQLSGMCICYTYSTSSVYFGEKPAEYSRLNGGFCMDAQVYGDKAEFYQSFKNQNKWNGQTILCMDYMPKKPEKMPDIKMIKQSNGFYVGEFDEIYKEGFGYLKFNDGNTYVGQFCEDQISGWGCFKSQNDLYIGSFYNGEYINDGMLVQNYGKPNQNILCGEFDGNQFDGKDVSPKGMHIL